ncbi:MAG TPA: hypothetical protein PLR92_07185, partial [Alicycliphilus denitrificans]|nr:hypothetical protein [Alicycliphilus denitrificans]
GETFLQGTLHKSLLRVGKSSPHRGILRVARVTAAFMPGFSGNPTDLRTTVLAASVSTLLLLTPQKKRNDTFVTQICPNDPLRGLSGVGAGAKAGVDWV